MPQTITKDAGMGPYLYVLQYRTPKRTELQSSRVSETIEAGETMVCVFTKWDDMYDWRTKLEANGITTTWDLAVDHMSRENGAS